MQGCVLVRGFLFPILASSTACLLPHLKTWISAEDWKHKRSYYGVFSSLLLFPAS
jgi:hypothetical protein